MRVRRWIPAVGTVVLLGGALLGAGSVQAAPRGPRPRPAPHVLPMADRLTGTVHGPGRAHRQAVSPEVDGCDHNYVDGGGTRSICLPLHAPGTKPVTCAYLAQHGFTKVKVAPHGQNRKKLPVGKGGFVCKP